MDRAGAYVGLTRGRESNTAWAVTDLGPSTDPIGNRERVSETSRGLLARAVTDTPEGFDAGLVPDRAAIDQADADDARRASAATLLGLIESETHIATRARLDADLDSLTADGILTARDRARLGADQGTAHLARLLRAHEQAGADPADLLRAVLDDARGLDDAKSVAQVVAGQLDRAHPLPAPATDPTGTVPGVPGRIPADRQRYLNELHGFLDDRRSDLGVDIAADSPGWAVTALGEAPDDPAEHARWQARAGVIAVHREATGWDHPEAPVGRCPGVHTPEKRAAWHAAYTAAGMPEERRPETEMTTGRLLVRARAAAQAKAAAPAAVYDAQRHYHQRADALRREAALARTTGDEAAAATVEAAASEHAQAADRLDFVSQVRAEHLIAHSETLAAGDAAHAELTRRGPQQPAAPSVTAAEWLAAEQHARQVDDAHRDISETDVDEQATDTGQPPADVDDGASAPPAELITAPASILARASAVEILAAAAHADAAREHLADYVSQTAAEPAATDHMADDEWVHVDRRERAAAHDQTNDATYDDAA